MRFLIDVNFAKQRHFAKAASHVIEKFKFWIYCNMCLILIIVSVRKVKLYIGNEESHLRELRKWDEDLLDSESVIYCGVEGFPSPHYRIWRKARDAGIDFVIRDYFPYWENEDTNTRWAALAVADIEWGREFKLICVASLTNESISTNIHFPGSKTFLYSILQIF